MSSGTGLIKDIQQSERTSSSLASLDIVEQILVTSFHMIPHVSVGTKTPVILAKVRFAAEAVTIDGHGYQRHLVLQVDLRDPSHECNEYGQ
jgi:hypothetical protein